jgi:hypothetical protein
MTGDFILFLDKKNCENFGNMCVFARVVDSTNFFLLYRGEKNLPIFLVSHYLKKKKKL